MSRGVRVQFKRVPVQQPVHQPPPPPPQTPRTAQPPKSGGAGKAVAAIVIIVVLLAVFYFVFVAKLVEREEVREAKYEIVDQGQDVDDSYQCIDWDTFLFWSSCNEYGWVRDVSAHISIRSIETRGAFVVTAEVVSGLYLQGEKKSQEWTIYENDVWEFEFDFGSFIITEDQHLYDDDYTIDMSVSAPKIMVEDQITIFESLF
jgi:hypothetical protein